MAPTRVGFIGLSKVGWAPKAHLPYLQSSPDYEIVAICNSTVESSKASIKAYGLPSSVKAYANPEDIANDKDIDLVVCSVRVDRHYATIAPSLKAGKDVLVEWPLGKNLAEAEELLKLKNEGGVKNAVVDLQARQAPFVKKIKELLDSGTIGKVLSSTWTGAAGLGGASIMAAYQYIAKRDVGGNIVTIHFGHSIDYIQAVLGYGFSIGPKTTIANRRPTITLLDDDAKTILNPTLPKTSDDTIFLTGTLASSVPISVSLRGGAPFKGQPGLDWRIAGSEGEIRITASGPFLQIGSPDMKIEVHDHASDELKEVGWEEEFAALELPARNVASVYKELKAGRINCTFEDAVERHRFIKEVYRDSGIDA
ncbi:Galactose/lactose metabolism regulatory protein [Lachnellula subtilissima]|uniref:Galactose/lactose metabolism regulatory protein n=1 Tax=Lachnellula subtilissima TaxID=602034 RepID=A0A8H8RMM6_9HELO|nr:Galactose/lactose metabolism regulatory protein [Lachnellula subtilissima]